MLLMNKSMVLNAKNEFRLHYIIIYSVKKIDIYLGIC